MLLLLALCRPHLVAAATNTGAVLLSFDSNEKPPVVALPAQVKHQSCWLLFWRVECWVESAGAGRVRRPASHSASGQPCKQRLQGFAQGLQQRGLQQCTQPVPSSLPAPFTPPSACLNILAHPSRPRTSPCLLPACPPLDLLAFHPRRGGTFKQSRHCRLHQHLSTSPRLNPCPPPDLPMFCEPLPPPLRVHSAVFPPSGTHLHVLLHLN